MGMTEKSQTVKQKRLTSIDAFRGLTIFGMILVLNPGSWKYVYPVFKHANWHGCTIADLVYPFFLFIVGVSITYSLGRSKFDVTGRKVTYLKIAKRSIILFIIGLFINSIPDFNLSEFRIMGVLQRIAICYLIVSVIFLNTQFKTQVYLTAFLLLVYWAIMEFIPLPGNIIGSYEKGESVATYLDKIVLKGYMGYYEKLGEPEGIISTLPSLATTLFGVLAGNYLKLNKPVNKASVVFFSSGIVLTVLGMIWNNWMPINKHLWTSSYSIYTAGLALIIFSIFNYLIDVRDYRKWSKPFIVFGMNAITVYVLSIVFAKIIKMITFVYNDKVYHARSWLYEKGLVELFGQYGGSLFYAFLYTSIWCGIMWLFYNKKIFIKV